MGEARASEGAGRTPGSGPPVQTPVGELIPSRPKLWTDSELLQDKVGLVSRQKAPWVQGEAAGPVLSSWGSIATPDKNPEKGDDRDSHSNQGSTTGGCHVQPQGSERSKRARGRGRRAGGRPGELGAQGLRTRRPGTQPRPRPRPRGLSASSCRAACGARLAAPSPFAGEPQSGPAHPLWPPQSLCFFTYSFGPQIFVPSRG